MTGNSVAARAALDMLDALRDAGIRNAGELCRDQLVTLSWDGTDGVRWGTDLAAARLHADS